jgi:carbonic anhydrase/acetyltransferase-like protein (isoleucine patch superfamily)
VIYQLEDRRVVAEGEHFIADSASVIGHVRLKDNVGIWFGAVLRGDNEPIVIGENSNVQECCVLHTDPGSPLTIGDYCTVGHKAVVHGCTVGDNTLIGINSVILNGARIGRNCLIGAGALVTEGKEIPDNSLVLGSPGRVVRQLNEDEVKEIRNQAERYARNLKRFNTGLSVQTEADGG